MHFLICKSVADYIFATLKKNIIYSEKKFFSLLKHEKEIFILCDMNTEKYCLSYISKHFKIHKKIILPNGDENKNLKSAENILKYLSENNATRNALLINLGGGMISDIGGFCASIYKRGIRHINIPTTLLAMTDAAHGRKTGINFSDTKNILGTFKQPEYIFINNKFLNTLDERQVRSGFAEMLKHGLIADKKHWNELIKISSSKNISLLQIKKSVEIKNKIVAKDVIEVNGIREILNFGHTIGHAVESLYMNTKNPLLHGEAVAYGMFVESYISMKLNLLSEKKYSEIKNELQKIYSETFSLKFKPESIKKYLYNDKKIKNKKIKMILLTGFGRAVSCIVEEKIIFSSLAALQKF